MNILLVGINAKYIHSNPAIYSLAAYAGQFTDENGNALKNYIEIAEYTINQRVEEIEADIYKKKPDVLAISCYIWNFSMVQEIIADIHEICPKLPVWLGGPEVSFHPDQLLQKFPFLAGIMIGEGEQTFVELVQWYLNKEKDTAVKSIMSCARTANQESGSDGSGCKDIVKSGQYPENIPGLYLFTGYTNERECMELDKIPFFYEDLSEFANRIMYYESSRGCPFRCKYCLSSLDKKLRFRSLELVKKELKFFLDNKVPQVKFIDRTFNANHEHAMEIWQYILEHDNGITNFHFEISADLLKVEEIELLSKMRKGLVQLEIGVQSTNEQTIAAINRTMNLEKLRKSVEKINGYENIHQHLDLIAGLPYEDYESFHQSFNDVYSMRPEQLQLGFLKVLKGSAMEEQAMEYGIGYRKTPPYEVLYTKWLSYEDVIRLKGIEEMVELFYNSGQFSYTIAFLESVIGDAFLLYEKLAEFYEKNQYIVASSKRISHYEHLLDFVKELLTESVTKDDRKESLCHRNEQEWEKDHMDKLSTKAMTDVHEILELCREYLLFDCYLRENMKTAPSFAQDMAAHRTYLREFYQQEEKERKYLPEHLRFDSKQMAKMTHVEFFRYPVWEKEFWKHNLQEETEVLSHFWKFRSEVQQPVLFDYQSRNPITKGCRVVRLPLEIVG